MDEGKPISLSSARGTRDEFPFDCLQGRRVLERHPIRWSFKDFHVRHPENLLCCRQLELSYEVRFPITQDFKDCLDFFRESLILLHIDVGPTTSDQALVNALV